MRAAAVRSPGCSAARTRSVAPPQLRGLGLRRAATGRPASPARPGKGAAFRVVLGARWRSAGGTANLSGLGVLFY